MSYKVYLWDSWSAIEWSQVTWRMEGTSVSWEACEGEMIHDVMLRHLPQDGLIVDAGCGTAKWPIYLRRRGYRCVGLEISSDACRIARGLDTGLPVACTDTRRAPLRGGAADAVFSLGVVEHDEAGPLEGLRELRRILKTGGLLVLAVPFDNLFRRLVVNHLRRYVDWKRRRANARLVFAEYRFTRRELHRYLRATGFEPLHDYPNDLLPPKIMGLWVDWDGLRKPSLIEPLTDLFVLRGLKGRIARLAVRRTPWLVCGEVVVVARAR